MTPSMYGLNESLLCGCPRVTVRFAVCRAKWRRFSICGGRERFCPMETLGIPTLVLGQYCGDARQEVVDDELFVNAARGPSDAEAEALLSLEPAGDLLD